MCDPMPVVAFKGRTTGRAQGARNVLVWHRPISLLTPVPFRDVSRRRGEEGPKQQCSREAR